MDTPEKMSSFKIAAMYSAAKISSRKCRRELMKHLRHHFGKYCFEPEYKVQMLCDGHTAVRNDSIEYAYEVGGIKETIDYSVKNMADEMAVQLARQLNSKGVLPDTIDRVDVVHGGDHGCGAFIAGSRVSVILLDTGDKSKESFSFEISVAEIQCRKYNAEISYLSPSKTI